MASYQAQVLDAPPQYGFLQGLGQGIASGSEKFSNIYAESMMKDMFAKKEAKRRQEAINKFQASMQKDPTMEMDAVSMDESGNPKWTYKRKKTQQDVYKEDPSKLLDAVKRTMMTGLGAEDTGPAMGIQPQQPMNPYQAAMTNEAILSPMMQKLGPGMNIPGVVSPLPQPQNPQLTGPMDPTGNPIDYPRHVQKAFQKKMGGGYNELQLMREGMGLPMETAEEKTAAAEAQKQKTYDPATTQTVQKNVKTPEDIDELLKNRKDYEDAGVDVVGILKEFINSGKADPGMLQKIMRFFTED